MASMDIAPQEHQAIRDRELRLFGASINPCHSIPPRHSPYTASDGHTYCTRCGEDITAPGIGIERPS